MTDLLAPYNTPFAVALAVLALLVLVQLAGLGHLFPDADLHADLDLHADIHVDADGLDFGGGLASLLGIGKLPLVVWLSFFLAAFALIGLSLQHLVAGLFGAPFGAAAASGAALLVAVPVNALITDLVGRVWPRDETTAVPIEALLGKRGTISIGTARRGSPARAAVRDHFGHTHHVMVEPHADEDAFEAGDEVLLVHRDGDLFYAMGESPLLRSEG